MTRIEQLFLAIEKGQLSRVRALLDTDASLLEARGTANARTMDKTPLSYALQCRARATARELIRRGADISVKMPDGGTLLGQAVRFAGPGEADHDAMQALIGELIDAGADPSDGLWPALHAYQRTAPWRARMIAFLLERGADPERVLATGSTIRRLVEVNRKLYPPEVLARFGLGE